MAFWLLKSEPESWSWQDQQAKGVEPWNGVRNFQAAKNMKAMRIGDHAFFYHSGKERRIMGIVEIAREYYPDPTDESGRFGMVEVKTVDSLPRPVGLNAIKAEPLLSHLPLLRQSRLSVQPVDENSWALIRQMGGLA